MKEQLLNYILTLTPEQVEKVIAKIDLLKALLKEGEAA